MCGLVACATPRIQNHPDTTQNPQLTPDAVIMADGYRLPLTVWSPQGTPVAVVLALHGFNDYRASFESPAGFLAAEQAGGDDFRVVEHQQIALRQQSGQIAEMAVRNIAAPPRQVQKAAVSTPFQRLLGDQFWRQVEVEIAAFQCRATGNRERRTV